MGRKDEGFTLIEVVCVLAIVGLLAAVAMPLAPRATSAARLQGYAVEIASLLKADRNAAIERHALVSTYLSADARLVASGSGRGRVNLPADVSFDATVARTCDGRSSGASIDFFPNGMSCGGTIGLARPGGGYQVRVNWLTGGVEIVPVGKS